VLELRRSLQDSSGNELSKLFHITLKDVVKKGLDILVNKLPELNKEKFERPNSQLLLKLRNDFLAHENNIGTTPRLKSIFDFVIMLYDSDDYYRHRIDWVIQEIKKKDFVYEGSPRELDPKPLWWNDLENRRFLIRYLSAESKQEHLIIIAPTIQQAREKAEEYGGEVVRGLNKEEELVTCQTS